MIWWSLWALAMLVELAVVLIGLKWAEPHIVRWLDSTAERMKR